ncbi:SusC/RagA family TonB-linked outer membrane protein [Mangrovivirga sp. M17]|uniref:SusC/RagA family TonB-linked outer membrane protein n=1 Tax=Mangrovivirga halotolerans TaxID=2993936 RepID=A0ABT3RPW9_9BACT|nr:SusC/RagA family TonB-linked outer membrane protein [Mangrovivirga halotolerans]MCX2743637.1 SusC/RagA family TonB-linked outer membrane protein [Mangrovivirga halotolerans]
MKIKSHLLLLFACGFFTHLTTFAQINVSGRVVDNEGQPLIGVTIIQEGTSKGATTNVEGRYAISDVDPNATLVFSFVGFTTKKVPVNNRTTIDVIMQEDLEQLEEVVVTALGFKEDKDKVGYANTVVSGDAVTRQQEPTLINSLSGQSSGVRISRNSGDPGAGAAIQIRGMSSILRPTGPLIVVDGVPISNDVRGNGNGRIAQQSRLNDLNPNDIESMTVLKGASAAALWGTKALGGVIVITTKSGKYNQKVKVRVQSTYSIDKINRRYPLQSKFGQGDNGIYEQGARDSWGDKISEREGGSDVLDTDGEFFIDQNGNAWYPIIDKRSQEIFDDSNFDQVFQTGHFFENNISVTGGGENSSVFFSVSDMNQEGIIKDNSDYRRSTVRLNTEHLLGNKFTFKSTSNYTRTSSNRIRRGASSSGLYLGLLRNAPDFDISGYRGDYYESPDAAPITNRQRAYRNPLGESTSPGYNNPLWTIKEQENIAVVDRFINSINLTYSPLEWLDLIGRVGLDHYSERRQEFFTPGSAAGAYRTGLFGTNLATNTILNMDFIAKARHQFSENFSLNGLVGFNYNSNMRRVEANEIESFIQFTDVASTTRDISNALPENRRSASAIFRQRTAGVYTSITAEAFNQLYVTGTFRAEAASTFGSESDNQFLFPSISVAWQFTEILDLSPISFGKLRFSYGEVGVQPELYRTRNEYVTPNYSDQFGGSLFTPLYGNGTFVPSTSVGNPDLRPERKKETEIGIDLRFFKNRLSLSTTYFDNVTEDVLLDFPIANSRGYDEIYANGAEISNKGWEVEMGYRILTTEDWNWNINLNYTRLRNKVTDIGGVNAIELPGGLNSVANYAVEGYPIGVLRGSKMLRDDQNNLVFDEFGFPILDSDLGVIGNPLPDWQGALSTSLSYKNFTLTALFETFQGADIFAGTKSVLYDLGRWEDSAIETTFDQNLVDFSGNVIPAGTTFRGVVKDFGAGPVALTEPWYNGPGGFFGNGIDELYIEDGSWTRLRELSLSYYLENEGLNNLGIEGVNFTVTGRNLLLWSDFEGNDPDTNVNGITPYGGTDYFNNPGTKSYVFSLGINF